jgi:hypothetical protein
MSIKGIIRMVAIALILPVTAYAAPPTIMSPHELTTLFTANPELKTSFTTHDKLTAQFVKTVRGGATYKVQAPDGSGLIVTVQPPANTSSPDAIGTLIDIGIAVFNHVKEGGCTTTITTTKTTIDGHSLTIESSVTVCKA